MEVGQAAMQLIILMHIHSWMVEEAEGVNIMLLGVRGMIKDQEQRRPYGKYPDGGMARKRTERSLESSNHAHVQRFSCPFPRNHPVASRPSKRFSGSWDNTTY